MPLRKARPALFNSYSDWSRISKEQLAVAIQCQALNADLAGRQTQVATLVALVAIEYATTLPLAINENAFLNPLNACDGIAGSVGGECHGEAMDQGR